MIGDLASMHTARTLQQAASGRIPALLAQSSHQYAVCLPSPAVTGRRRTPHFIHCPTAAPHPHQPQQHVDVRAASNSSSSSNGSNISSVTSSGSFNSSGVRTAFKKHSITGDGSCMFRACVQGDFHALTGSCMSASRETEKALQLRKDVVAQLANSREEMEPFLPGIADDFDGYLKVMSRPGVWGGEPELLMASRVLKRPICVYQSSWTGPQHIVTYGEELLKNTAPIHLLWSGAHYDLLLPQTASRL